METYIYERLLSERFPDFIGSKYPPNALINPLGYVYEPVEFHFTVDFEMPATKAVTLSKSFLTDSDTDFYIHTSQYAFFNKTTAGALVTSDSGRLIPQGLYTEMTDGGSNRIFMNDTLPVPTVFGTGERPFMWAVPHRLKASSTFKIQLTSRDAVLSADLDYGLSLTFSGIKRYYFGKVEMVQGRAVMGDYSPPNEGL